MMEDKIRWAEIRIDYLDEETNFWSVDAWKTTDDNEDGRVIAYIDNHSGRVVYTDPLARIDKYAQEEIAAKVAEIKKEHPFSVTELEGVLNAVADYESSEECAVNNLRDMGFSDEMMQFFGINPNNDLDN